MWIGLNFDQIGRMRVSYRMTSGAVLSVYIAGIIYGIFFSQKSRPTETAAADGTVAFDRCGMMWEQMSPTKQLAALVCGPSILGLFIQGLRNRPVPRWVAVAGLTSLAVTLWYDKWRI